MNAIAFFLMVRERLSHSLVDGRLLTAAGPAGDHGLRRLLSEPMVLEEFAGRLSSILKIGRNILKLRRDGEWGRFDAEVALHMRAIRSAISGGSSHQTICIRGEVLEIRELLRVLGDMSLFRPAALPTFMEPAKAFEQRTQRIVELITQALDSDLSPLEVAELAHEYWVERLTAEEEFIARGLLMVAGEIVIHDSVEDALWVLHGFDDVAELAISCKRPALYRRASCENLLRGEVFEKLQGLAEHAANLVSGLIDSKG